MDHPGTALGGNRPVVEIAVGGLVWNRRGPFRRLAVIHRPVQQDWTLPKGKLEHDEAPEAGALREVREEIGVEASLGRLAGHTFYLKHQRPKLVLYWHMVRLEERDFTPNKEVDEVRWLRPADALKLLSYETEQNLLRTAAGCCSWMRG
jgi:8-oxo-dGTP diphosphatase